MATGAQLCDQHHRLMELWTVAVLLVPRVLQHAGDELAQPYLLVRDSLQVAVSPVAIFRRSKEISATITGLPFQSASAVSQTNGEG
jgi:hypothetical protein